MREIKIKDETTIKATDYEAKYEKIKGILNTSLFDELSEKQYDISYSKNGDEIKRKRNTKKNEVLPTITPQQVYCKLESCLRLLMPMSSEEAHLIAPQEYLNGYFWFCELMFYVNKFIVFNQNKQLLCAFLGILPETYDEFIGDQMYGQAFKSIESGLVGSGFVSAESGLSDTKAVDFRMQAKGVGHSVAKADSGFTFNQLNVGMSNESIDQKLRELLPEPIIQKKGK